MTASFDSVSFKRLARQDQIKLLVAAAEEEKRFRTSRFWSFFPDEDTVQRDGSVIHARWKYQKHVEFLNAGKQYRERCLLAANRTGKTIAGAYETTCHLTGIYPDWWQGKRFDQPIRAWAAGKTNETTRDIVQTTLCGEVLLEDNAKHFSGTGMIPGQHLGKPGWKQGIIDLADKVKVKHVPTGEWSTLGFKSYQQGRGSFEGTAIHAIWLDEEPPLDVYGECLIRTATTHGLVYITFTPLDGISDVVMQFLPQDQKPA